MIERMYNLLSNDWTPQDKLNWRTQVTPPLCSVSLAFCVVAQILVCILFAFIFAMNERGREAREGKGIFTQKRYITKIEDLS